MPTVTAVLFDRDETLCTTDTSVYQQAAAWMETRWGTPARQALGILARHWQEKAEDWWHLRSHDDETAFWDEYTSELAQKLGLQDGQARELAALYPYEAYLKAVPNARQVLLHLRAAGLKIGVLSNTLPSIDRTLKAIDLADLVDVPLATCLLGVHKPDLDAFRLAAEAMGLPPQQILFVDDRIENVEAARRVGMPAYLIDLTGQQPGALHTLDDVLKVPELLGALPQT